MPQTPFPSPPPSETPGSLFPLVYDELRALAAARLRQEGKSHTLQPTALVHEVFLKLGSHQGFRGRDHFLCVAVEAMRRVLIDHARAKKAAKRGGGDAPTSLTLIGPLVDERRPDQVDLLALDDALTRLESLSERHLRIVELRFFGGLTIEQTAGALGLAPKTVEAEWTFVRAWLRKELRAGDGPAS